MPTEPTPEQWQQIEAEIFAGRKIQAIKIYRQAVDVDLKEAKDAVEAREGLLREKSPDRFEARGGCLGVIVLVAGLVGVVGAIVWTK